MKHLSLNRLAVTVVMMTALGVAMFVAVPRSYADDDHAKCQRQIEKAEARLDQAVRRHGEGSSQARDRRRDLNAERERCYNTYHGWWDGHEKRWHDARDWDQDQDHHDDHHQ